MRTLPDKLLHLLSIGRPTFSKLDVSSLLGMSLSAFEDAAQRAVAKGLLIHPRRGFYVIVPPQRKAFGGPPPAEIIDDLMKFEQAPYYIGLLKAAEIHGAAHQAVMAFQVLSSNRMPAIPLGRGVIEFYYSKSVAPDDLIERRQTDAGYYLVSSPALTAADLLRYPRAAGTLDAAASVISDLAEKIDPVSIGKLRDVIATPTLQRLGYIFDQAGAAPLADEVHTLIGAAARRIELDTFSSDRRAGQEVLDDRWKVIVRRPLELDDDPQEHSSDCWSG